MFRHVEKEDNSQIEMLKRKNKDILKNISDVEISIKDLENKILKSEEIITKLVMFEKRFERMEAFEKHLAEKANIIKDLSRKVNSADEKINILSKKLEKVDDTIKASKASEESRKDKLLKCTNCNFTTKSKQGLKIHMKKKHTVVDNDTFQQSCHLCEKICKNRNYLKKYLFTHSYKKAKFKCSECVFVCQNEISMEVHIGKHHSEQLGCGLCDLEVSNLEKM